MTILMVHTNPVDVSNGRLRVDRKFHVGMLEYVKHLGSVATANPNLRPEQAIMDAIEVPLAGLPYEIINVDAPGISEIAPSHYRRLLDRVRGASLVYGFGLSSAEIAYRVGVPYIQILEHDLDIQLRLIAADTTGLRRAVRSAKCVGTHYLRRVPEMRRAHSLHCNGYPVFNATEGIHKDRLLYLDSRMTALDVIGADQLAERLCNIEHRSLRLFYSGRYEQIKGVVDVVRVAIECLKRGLPVELDCYGQGSLHSEMERLAHGHPAIRIHGPVPYPELVNISKRADIFLCCHIQSDPSCTYLESMGAGLPIVGYGNRMWMGMRQASNAGLTGPIGDIPAMATLLGELIRNRRALDHLSTNARSFALAHTFEREYSKRIEALKHAARGRSARAPN